LLRFTESEFDRIIPFHIWRGFLLRDGFICLEKASG
jgi:hypothetical protein